MTWHPGHRVLTLTAGREEAVVEHGPPHAQFLPPEGQAGFGFILQPWGANPPNTHTAPCASGSPSPRGLGGKAQGQREMLSAGAGRISGTDLRGGMGSWARAHGRSPRTTLYWSSHIWGPAPALLAGDEGSKEPLRTSLDTLGLPSSDKATEMGKRRGHGCTARNRQARDTGVCNPRVPGIGSAETQGRGCSLVGSPSCWAVQEGMCETKSGCETEGGEDSPHTKGVLRLGHRGRHYLALPYIQLTWV